MATVAELVATYTLLLKPCHDKTGFLTTANHHYDIVKEFCTAVRRLEDIEAEIIEGLHGLLVDHDWRRITLWLNAANVRKSVGLVGPLCDLLDVRNRYIQHEWIAEILGEIGSAQAVRSLIHAFSFDIDASRSFHKRCLEALVSIGTPEAISAVKSQLSSPWPEVREYATELLNED